MSVIFGETYPLGDLSVDVDYSYFPPVPATWDDPPCDAKVMLLSVLHQGVDISEHLSVTSIETLIDTILEVKNV